MYLALPSAKLIHLSETRHEQGEVDIKEAKAEDVSCLLGLCSADVTQYASAKSDKVTAKVDNVISTVTGDVVSLERYCRCHKLTSLDRPGEGSRQGEDR